jgi:hypothetical protein
MVIAEGGKAAHALVEDDEVAAVAEKGLEVGAGGAERDAGVSDLHDLNGALIGARRAWRRRGDKKAEHENGRTNVYFQWMERGRKGFKMKLRLIEGSESESSRWEGRRSEKSAGKMK